MTTLAAETNAINTTAPIHAARSLSGLNAKRDAPQWVATAIRADPATVWKQLREEMPRPFADAVESRFPMLDSAASRANAILAGAENLRDVPSANERLQLLVVLLDGFAHGRFPKNDDALRDLWWWIWNESEQFSAEDFSFEDPFSRLLHAEILIASGVYFTGFSGMRTRVKRGRKQLWDEVARRTDTDGTPAAELLDLMPGWLASLERSRGWMIAGEMRWGKSRELELHDGMLRSAATMLRADGTCCGTESGEVATWLLAAGQSLNWKSADPVMRFLSRLTDTGKSRNSKPKRGDKQSTAMQSEWAKIMATRSAWTAETDLLLARHDGLFPFLEWHIGGRAVMAGEWGLDIRVDGKPVELTADWDAVSWFEDAEVVYLELQQSGVTDPIICRQLLWTRGDQQLWLADSVSTPTRPESEIEVTSRLPFAAGWEFEQRKPTRELRLTRTRGETIRCVPLAFPMQATQEGPGSIRAVAGEFQIRQTGRGGVYCPLLFDWHSPRRNAPVDWRTLTVTEDGRRLTGAEALAARVRIGPQQWLMYRNMNGSTAMRTAIGYHHNQESVIGRFTRDGEVDPLVLVEASED